MFKEQGITRDEIQNKMTMYAAPAWMDAKLLSEKGV
jgi:hypothetical protein